MECIVVHDVKQNNIIPDHTLFMLEYKEVICIYIYDEYVTNLCTDFILQGTGKCFE